MIKPKFSSPITTILTFNLFTVFIYITAPINWMTDYFIISVLYILLCQIFIYVGYKFGFKAGTEKSLINSTKKYLFNDISDKQLTFVFIFYSLTFLIKYGYILRFSPLDIEGMVMFLLIGIADPDLGYALTLDSLRPTTIPWTIYFVVSIVNQLFFIIGFLCWSKLNKPKKILFLLFLLVEVFFWLGRATNMGIIVLITTYLLTRFYKNLLNQSSRAKNIKFFVITLILLTISISVFSYNLSHRTGSDKVNYQSFNLGNSVVDEGSLVFSILSEPLHETYLFMVYYLAQGYYHTSLAFDLDFIPTFFWGNNPAVMSLGEILGIDVWKDTYMYRLGEKGVDPLIQWHSAYLWYASDVSFLGVPFLLFLISYLLGFSWGYSSNSPDFLSKIIFVILGNMLLFLFANNSYLSMFFYSFMFAFPFWYFTRVRKKDFEFQPEIPK